MDKLQETGKAEIEAAEKWRRMIIEQLPRIINIENLKCVYFLQKE